MIIGHYAAALIPHARRVNVPLPVLLLCANASDFLWMALALAGVEAPQPASMWDATFTNMQVDMRYSHDVIPSLLFTLLVVAMVRAVYGSWRAAFWCGALGVVHSACDLLSGFEHHVWGQNTPAVGLDLFHTHPHVALTLEAAFGALCVWGYLALRRNAGAPIPARGALTLYGVFVLGALIWLPTSTQSLGELLGLK
jgi:hypothetical protein